MQEFQEKIEGEKETISRFQKYEQILITHYENKEKYQPFLADLQWSRNTKQA